MWLRYQADHSDAEIGTLSPETLAARAGKFSRETAQGPMNYAFHVDASRYAEHLRKYAIARGVSRHVGEVVDVLRDGESGAVTALKLASGTVLDGDLFIDCSGFRGVLIEGTLQTGYCDWTHWLPCDRAVAVPTTRTGPNSPYTRSTRREAGWQWRIPLQHRAGNGYVYSSAFHTEAEAARLLGDWLDDEFLDEPRTLRFKTGRRRLAWNRNCVAIGLSAGFVEPLESTSIHLIQTAIFRLLGVFPGPDIEPHLVARFNLETEVEYAAVRDFVIAHYALAAGDTPFWRAVKDTAPPESLTARLETFARTGTILYETRDLFGPTNWYAVLTGQGLRPRAYHPMADAMDGAAIVDAVCRLGDRAASMIAEMAAHDEFVAAHCQHGQMPLNSATTS